MIDVVEIAETGAAHLRIDDIPGAADCTDATEAQHRLPECFIATCSDPALFFVQTTDIALPMCGSHTDAFYTDQEWDRVSITGVYVYRLQDVMTKLHEYEDQLRTEARARAKERARELRKAALAAFTPTDA